MGECWSCIKIFVIVAQVILAISALVVVSMASAKIDQRVSYDKYFVGSGDDYDNMRESGRLQRLALILGISGYWTYIAVVITGAIGLFVGSKFSSSKCLTVTWLLTAVMLLISLFAVSMNVTSVVFTIDASNKFNLVASRVMKNLLRHNDTNDIARRSTQSVVEDTTESSTGVLWDDLQYEQKCCGYRGVSDYINGAWNSNLTDRPEAVAPLSCCGRLLFSPDLQFCVNNGTKSWQYYNKGCYSVLSNFCADDKKIVILMSCFVIPVVVISVFYVIFDSWLNDDDD